jgi:hypothetical protein
MSRRLITTACIAAALFAGMLAVAATPASTANTGTVNAVVLVGVSPCITISSPPSGSAVDYGNLAFSTTGGLSEASGTPDITVASCANASETVFASGTNATGTNASWTLTTNLAPNQCGNALNQYRLGLRVNANDLFLTTTNQPLGALAANGSLTRTPRITMPCSGSGGNGQTMNMSFNFIATIP